MVERTIGIAFVGIGYTADLYMRTLGLHPQLRLVGVFDRDAERSQIFAKFHGVSVFSSLEELLTSRHVGLVLNLTEASEHFEVSKACLEAGKHLYSEKPLAMTMRQAHELVEIAKEMGLEISAAPCSVLGESAQTLWKAIRESVVGKIRLIYAEMENDSIYKISCGRHRSESGFAWPNKGGFEQGGALGFAGYYTTWLTAMFGPAKTVTAFSASLSSQNETEASSSSSTEADFAVACIQFASGLVARLTCGRVAPYDHSLRAIGDKGVLVIEDCLFEHKPVLVRRMLRLGDWRMFHPFKRTFPLVRKPSYFKKGCAMQMDLMRGPAEVASSVLEGRKCRIGADFSLHNTELVLAIHNARETGTTCVLRTTFDAMAPMEWAK
jgi:predicted dehydrogenase